MLTDKLTTFASAVNFFGAAGTAKIGDAIDLGPQANQGVGEPLYLVITFTASLAGAGSTCQFNLVTADNEALDSNASVLTSSPARGTGTAIAGVPAFVVALPQAAYRKWLGITVTRTGTSTAGAVNAFLTQEPDAWRAYPEGIN